MLQLWWCVSDGWQRSVVKSSIGSSRTQSSCCYCRLVRVCPYLSHGGIRWTNLCLITTDAVRLVWTLCSHYDSGFVHTCLTTALDGRICVLSLFMQWDLCGHYAAVVTMDLSTLVHTGLAAAYPCPFTLLFADLCSSIADDDVVLLKK